MFKQNQDPYKALNIGIYNKVDFSRILILTSADRFLSMTGEGLNSYSFRDKKRIYEASFAVYVEGDIVKIIKSRYDTNTDEVILRILKEQKYELHS